MTLLADLVPEISRVQVLKSYGAISSVRGAVLFARLPHTAIGDLCLIRRRDGSTVRSQVISFADELVCLAPFDDLEGVSPGAEVYSTGAPLAITVGPKLLGQVVNCFGEPLSADPQNLDCSNEARVSHLKSPPPALSRDPIDTIMCTGVAAIDGLCTIGIGQRIGLFAGAGLGKSTLLGMISRAAEVDLSVVALVGERGREVQEFLQDSLGPEGMRRTIAVVATSDESPIRRSLAIETATRIAEHFRSTGKRVLLLVDSLTRAARALREVGLAAGEPMVRQGYTASVYVKLPKLLERAGNAEGGSITAIYTVLTNGEGESDPLGEEVRSLLDGHITLDSKVVGRGIRPAIDCTNSISRLLPKLHTSSSLSVVEGIRGILSRLKRDRDVLLFGGTPDKELAAALSLEPRLHKLLNQLPDEKRALSAVKSELNAIWFEYQELVALTNEP